MHAKLVILLQFNSIHSFNSILTYVAAKVAKNHDQSRRVVVKNREKSRSKSRPRSRNMIYGGLKIHIDAAVSNVTINLLLWGPENTH